MRFFFALSLLVLIDCHLTFADEKGDSLVQITLLMRSPDLPDSTEVYITGNLESLGNWRPDLAQMNLVESHTWSFELSVPRGTPLEYKYTLGDWGREGASRSGRPLANFRLTARESTVQEDRVEAWTNRKPRSESGQVTGEVRYHRQIETDGLRPRDVVVWLPPSYDSDDSRRYPVLYMHDGQNLFDPKTSAFGVDWQIDESITEMIEAKQVEPLIVVGIFNTPDRSREYIDGVTGRRYREFVSSQLKPFIDSRYRTKSERKSTFVGGSSAGGLCSFIMAWEHAETYSAALCLSPAFRFERSDGSVPINYVEKVMSSSRPKLPSRIYIDNGGKGVDEELMPGVRAMVDALRSKGYVEDEDLRVVIKPDDPHTESSWARRFPGAVKFLFD